MRGFEAIPNLLARAGAGVVFSMLGGTNVSWIGAGVRSGALSLVKTRHECTAVTAAMGYARASGRVGLCSVTRGPGFTNAFTALTAAARTHVPIVMIVAESPAPDPHNVQNIDQRALAAAAGLLAQARRPLIIAGQGAVIADCRAVLEQLADRLGARVATSMFANRFFSGHPADLGLGGGYAPPLGRSYLAESDVILAVGASLNVYTTGQGKLFGDARVIHLDIDPAAIGARTRADLALAGDARALLPALLREVERRVPAPRPPAFAEPVIGAIRDSASALDLGNRPGAGLDPRTVYRWLDRTLPRDRIIVTDGGRTLPLLPSLVDAPDARSFLVGWGFGSIGLGLGTAIGAAIARPHSHVALVVGDGGFMMAAEDLDAARLAGIDLTILVMNDRQYGAEMRHLRHYGLPPDIARQDPPDLVALARVFGGDGAVVADEQALEAQRLTRRGLWLLDIRIDRDADAKVVFGVGGPGRAAPGSGG